MKVKLVAILCFLVVSAASFAYGQTEWPIYFIYFADGAESPGSVYVIEDGVEYTYYTRSAGKLHNFTFTEHDYWPGDLYYSNANDNDLYMLDLYETLVYRHDTYLRDVAFDSQGRIYFSEATGGGGDGYIYRLVDGSAELYYTVWLSDVGGFWVGDFTFDRDDNLYLSSGNTTGANIYKVVDGVPQIVFSAPSDEFIKGMSFDSDGNVFYASWSGGNIYKVDLSTGERELFYSNPEHVWLSDVFVVDINCDDGNPCTEDSWNPETLCRNYPLPAGTPCPDDGNECTYDRCDGAGICIHPYRPLGDPCGDQYERDCSHPDTCNGAGQCLPNHVSQGTPCPDDGYECTDDVCDGYGNCTHPPNPASPPPEIISGPTVLEVTRNSAVISWQTNEKCDSMVRYGMRAGIYDSEVKDRTLLTSHSITLMDLQPSATYHFIVRSTNFCGNTVESHYMTFETLPLPDEIDPNVSIIDPGVVEGTVTLSADASDNIGVEKVEFYLGDALVFTAYSPPYNFLLSSTKYENGWYTLKAKVYDLSGRARIDERIFEIANVIDVNAPTVEITEPKQWDTVSGTIVVKASASDEEGLSHGYFYVGPDPKWHYASWYATSPLPKELTWEIDWKTKGADNGPLRIAWKVYDKYGNVGWGYQDVIVDNVLPPGPPKLDITKREITRDKNYFTISLTVKNVGGQTATSITIWDYLQLFQPIGNSDSVATYKPEFKPQLMRWKVEINSKVDIPKGGEQTYTYDAVPVLTPESAGPYASCPYPMIGAYAVCGDGWWKWEGDTHVQYQQPGGIGYFHEYIGVGEKIPDSSYFGATTEADYLIVTNPSQLFSHNQGNEDDVNGLLSDMAKLAKLEKGVLGYLADSDRNKLRNLIKPGATWAKANWAYRLHPDFSAASKGYLLIVGETEIFPSDDIPQKGTGPIHHSDQFYSDTYGDDDRPELAVGRIIGNAANNLSKAIRTSINIHEGGGFQRLNALVIAGNCGGEDEWEKDAKDVADILDDEFNTPNELLWNDYKDEAEMLQQFRNRVKDKDVIFFSDHGTPYEWCKVIKTGGTSGGTGDFPISFGNTNPFLFAAACSTANYDPVGDYGVAEAFFDSGVSVYVGSTVPSLSDQDRLGFNRFFKNWVNTAKSIGRAFVEAERHLVGNKGLYWVRTYNLYGDPKIGGTTSGSSAAASNEIVLMEEPLSFLEVVVPDYEVTTVDGLDYVEIPDGTPLFVEGKPQIPFYCVDLEYPAGYEIQDVLLTERSGLITTTGLNIVTCRRIVKNTHGEERDSTALTSWYPAEEYSWEVFENSDGSSTLVIRMYPFYYDSLTTDVRFYKNYSFDINYTVSPVAITSLITDKDEYEQGETVMVDMELDNSGEAQDVIVSAVIKRYGLDEIVDGLLLSTLKEFTGLASFSPEWDSSEFDPGNYYVEVTLKDTAGNVLDRKTKMFGLGISSGQITSFIATPGYFDIGDNINISLVFSNTGTVNITGTAIIRVQDEAGETVQEFSHDVTDLTPGNSISFDDVWDTSGAEEGSYRIVGYVLYHSTATDPMSVVVSTSPPCEGDFDCDRDVDGSDLAVFAAGETEITLEEFAADFGRTDCPPCAQAP